MRRRSCDWLTKIIQVGNVFLVLVDSHRQRPDRTPLLPEPPSAVVAAAAFRASPDYRVAGERHENGFPGLSRGGSEAGSASGGGVVVRYDDRYDGEGRFGDRFGDPSRSLVGAVGRPLPPPPFAAGAVDSGGVSRGPQEGAVLMVYGLNMEKINADRLFNLLCLYGNVFKVKFLKTKEGSAMVQMGDSASVERAIFYLNGLTFFNTKMNVKWVPLFLFIIDGQVLLLFSSSSVRLLNFLLRFVNHVNFIRASFLISVAVPGVDFFCSSWLWFGGGHSRLDIRSRSLAECLVSFACDNRATGFQWGSRSIVFRHDYIFASLLSRPLFMWLA